MLDAWTLRHLERPLDRLAAALEARRVHPDHLTLAAFATGLAAVPAIAAGHHGPALALILLSRLGDGLDGALARRRGSSEAGAFLDISLDFIFYAAIVFAFALADPAANALPAAALITSFMGTGGSFLAFAAMAARRGLHNARLPRKGLYYLNGLAEGTETILFLVACCLWPSAFPALAWGFCAICAMTTATRLVGGYRALRAT